MVANIREICGNLRFSSKSYETKIMLKEIALFVDHYIHHSEFKSAFRYLITAREFSFGAGSGSNDGVINNETISNDKVMIRAGISVG